MRQPEQVYNIINIFTFLANCAQQQRLVMMEPIKPPRKTNTEYIPVCTPQFFTLIFYSSTTSPLACSLPLTSTPTPTMRENKNWMSLMLGWFAPPWPYKRHVVHVSWHVWTGSDPSYMIVLFEWDYVYTISMSRPLACMSMPMLESVGFRVRPRQLCLLFHFLDAIECIGCKYVSTAANFPPKVQLLRAWSTCCCASQRVRARSIVR